MNAPPPAPEGGRFGAVEIRAAQRRVLVDGEPVALGARAFDLLAALAARRDRVVPKDELLDVVWPGLVVEENNLQVQISALRKLLGAQAIATVAGRGYRFTLAPTDDARAPGVASAAASPPPPLPTSPSASPRGSSSPGAGTPAARLLVVDDNKVHRLLLSRSLQLMGHEVDTVDAGCTALERLRRERFDLVLLDLELPGIDGFAVLEQRRHDAALQAVPVIVTSSVEGVAAVARCLDLGADDFLHKPVNPQLLRARVDASLQAAHLRDRQRELLARLAPGAGGDGRPPAGGRRVDATVLVARLCGLDADAAAQPPSAIFERLDEWTTLMLEAVEERGGRVAALAGDGVTAVFGAAGGLDPVEGGAPWAAVQAAGEMLQLTRALFADRRDDGFAPPLHIGVAGGVVLDGHVVTPRRAAPVCVGAPLQRAQRLQRTAADAGEPLLVDGRTADAVAGRAAFTALAPPRAVPGTDATPAHAWRGD